MVKNASAPSPEGHFLKKGLNMDLSTHIKHFLPIFEMKKEPPAFVSLHSISSIIAFCKFYVDISVINHRLPIDKIIYLVGEKRNKQRENSGKISMMNNLCFGLY